MFETIILCRAVIVEFCGFTNTQKHPNFVHQLLKITKMDFDNFWFTLSIFKLNNNVLGGQLSTSAIKRLLGPLENFEM